MRASIADEPLQSRQARSARSAAVAQTIHAAGCHFLFRCVPFADQPMQTKARTKQETKPMNIISLIIEAISGAVGGNMAGAAMKENSLGTVGIPSPELSAAGWEERFSRW